MMKGRLEKNSLCPLKTMLTQAFSFSSYPDEYVLEDLDLTVADYVQRAMKANFPAAWEELGPTNELEDTYALSSFKTLEEAVKNIVQFLGMQPCERSDKVPEGKSSHTLVMAGTSSSLLRCATDSLKSCDGLSLRTEPSTAFRLFFASWPCILLFHSLFNGWWTLMDHASKNC